MWCLETVQIEDKILAYYEKTAAGLITLASIRFQISSFCQLVSISVSICFEKKAIKGKSINGGHNFSAIFIITWRTSAHYRP